MTAVITNTNVSLPRKFSPSLPNNISLMNKVWATALTAQVSMAAVRGARVIARCDNLTWHPRSPDLSMCALFMWQMCTTEKSHEVWKN